MTFLVIKYILSALIIVIVSEVAKRSGSIGGLILSLPIVSILTFIWVYWENHDNKAVIDLSYSVIWFIIPSFVLFLALPILLKKGLPFYSALAMACVLTMISYAGFAILLEKFGIKL